LQDSCEQGYNKFISPTHKYITLASFPPTNASMSSQLNLNRTLTTILITNNLTSTPLPSTLIHPPQWDPATVYGIVFGIVAVLLAIPGAVVIVVHALRMNRRREDRLVGEEGIEDAGKWNKTFFGVVGLGADDGK
jgi:hypothetical protein